LLAPELALKAELSDEAGGVCGRTFFRRWSKCDGAGGVGHYDASILVLLDRCRTWWLLGMRSSGLSMEGDLGAYIFEFVRTHALRQVRF
jgi:hypothetical protein